MHLLFDKYLITPLFLLLIIAAFVGVWISFSIFKKRRKKVATFLSIWMLGAAIWSFTYAFEYAAVDVSMKIFWSKLSYLGIVLNPPSFFFFTLAYSSNFRYLKRKPVYITYFIAALFVIVVATNDYHHLHWASVSIYPEINTTKYIYGPFFWVFYLLAYSLLLASIVNLFLLYFRFPQRYQSQIGIFILVSAFPILGNLSYVTNVNPIPGFDWTPICFMISTLLLSINIFRYGAIDLIPFARNKLFDMMPDAVMVLDNDGRIADLNPSMSKLIEKKEKDIIGRNDEDVFQKLGKGIILSKNKNAGNPEFSIETEGENKHFNYQSTSLFDNKGNYSGELINIRDITERKNAENKIQKAYEQLKEEIVEKEKLIVDLDAFAHTVAHDLKNIIGAIITSTDLMKVSILANDKEEVDEIMDLIELSSKKMLHITQELLLLASVRQQEVKTGVLDMCHIVDEAIARNYSSIQEKKVQIIMPDTCLSAKGYGPWVEEVWANYISNAIKYGGNPPVIEFGSEDIGNNMIKFWIKDNGEGIPEDQQVRLFSKFTRLQNLKIEGHGLGLSIVKRIVDELGGTVGVESPAISGEGATFYFTLPSC